MKRISFCLSIALLAMTVQLIAQNHDHWKCGISADDGRQIKEALFETRIEMKGFVRPRNAITYVPVRFFMVAESNGEGRPSEALALKGLCRLNEAYADQEIQFYVKEFKYFNNSTVYDSPQTFGGVNAISNQMIYNAINVFVVDDAGDGAAAYYQLPYGPNGNDWIVSGDNYLDDVNTLVHEVGHFFTLDHPFYGWEEDGGWQEALHGNPVNATFTASGDLIELVDGSNCLTAGDGICDTPADFGFFFPGSGCNMTEQVFDANNDMLTPDLENHMNYANCNDYHFTDDQKEAIDNSLFSNARNYVRPNYTPNTDEVSGSLSIISPAQSETIDTYNSVYLEWTPVSGADQYLVEIVKTGSAFRYIIEGTSMVATELDPSSTYLWRVLPFNESVGCAGFSTQKIFKTGTDAVSDTSELPYLDDWTVQPNPVSSTGSINLNVESAKGIEATVRLLSMTGQQVASYPDYNFPAGTSTLEMRVEGIASGIYIVTLQTAQGMESRRVSVVD